MQTDPIGYKDDMDLYSYVGNDPMNKTDPTGLAGSGCYHMTYGQGTVCDYSGESGNDKNRPSGGVPKPLLNLQTVANAAESAGTVVNATNDALATGATVATTVLQPELAAAKILGTLGIKSIFIVAKSEKAFSLEKQALVSMAKADKKVGMTAEDMKAYKELNKTLPDPFPTNTVRGPEQHLDRAYNEVHGHVGPVDHIPIIEP